MTFDKNIAEEMYNRASTQLKASIDKCTPEDTKVVAIIGGQPGAGKSSITKKLEAKYNNNIVSLNGDDFKELYPRYTKLLAQDPDKTSDIVQPYSNYVVDRLKEDMIAKGLNVMVEGTMRNPDTPLKTAEQFTQHGYKAEAHVISVNEYASQASCIERYERDLNSTGSGRSVKLKSHDEAYNKIPATLQALSKSEQISNITVYNRNGDVIADLSKGDNVAQKYVAHREQITPELVSSVEKSINNSIQLKELRNAPNQEITDLNQLKDKLHNEFTKQNTISISKETKTSDVLNFFESKSPSIVSQIKHDNYIEHKGHKFSLDHATPKFVAERINEKLDTQIKISLDKSLEKSKDFER